MVATRGKNSGIKGSSYELKVSHLLSKAFKTSVNRVPESGAWRGNSNDYTTHNDERLLGDIMFPLHHPMNVFNFELKNHSDITLNKILKSSASFQDFVSQVTTDAHRKGNSVPILVIHVNYEDDYLVIPFSASFYKSIISSKNSFGLVTRVSFKDKRLNKLNLYDVIVTNLKTFMKQSQNDLVNWYSEVDWNSLNKGKNIKKDTNIDALDSVFSKINETIKEGEVQ